MLFLAFTVKFKHILCLIQTYINFLMPDFQPHPELFPFSFIRSLHIGLSVSRIQYIPVPSHLREFAHDNFPVLFSPYGQLLLCSFCKDSAQISFFSEINLPKSLLQRIPHYVTIFISFRVSIYHNLKLYFILFCYFHCTFSTLKHKIH